jgi:basic membrane protein A
MKKLLTVLLAVALVFSFAGCKSSSKGYELALVTDIGTIDDQSFNQGAWEGLKAYAEDNKISYKYYQPTEKSTAAYLDAITLAVDGGAKVVVCPGYLFENAVWEAQTMYPKVNFVLLDGSPHNVTDYTTMATLDGSAPDYTVADNTYSIFYKEQQAGFLAGYAAVKDGYTKLGFMGGIAVPAVIRYGYGFVQGAEYAAEEMV